MSHFCKKCKECYRVIEQCRCFDPAKTITLSICKSCKPCEKCSKIHSELVSIDNESENQKMTPKI